MVLVDSQIGHKSFYNQVYLLNDKTERSSAQVKQVQMLPFLLINVKVMSMKMTQPFGQKQTTFLAKSVQLQSPNKIFGNIQQGQAQYNTKKIKRLNRDQMGVILP